MSATDLRARFAAAGLDWIVPAWDAPATVAAFATTRQGGVSTGPAASLDLGPANPAGLPGPERADVEANRARVAAFLPAAPVWLEQVHGREVVTIDATTLVGARERPPRADAAITTLADVPLAVRTADCLAVLFASSDGSVVAAAHAGWRGLASGVLEATVAAMGVGPAALVAWLGPGIGPAAFEVGDDVWQAFCDDDRTAARRFVPGRHGKWLADLPGLARDRLAAAGVARVTGGRWCTHADTGRFFSYRRDPAAGRMAACVWRTHPADVGRRGPRL